MRSLHTIVFISIISLVFNHKSNAQIQAPVGYISSERGSVIYGIGFGLGYFNTTLDRNEIDTTTINGLGIILSFANDNPEINVKGVLISGLAHNTNTVNGICLAGIGTASKKVNGITVSIFNRADTTNGIQVNLIYSFCSNLNGVQFGFANLDKDSRDYTSQTKTKGLQLGIVNQAANLRGLQIGIRNLDKLEKEDPTITSTYGIQIGGLNQSSNLKGIQIGIINTSKSLKGVQIGLVNNSKKVKGLQIGLINVNEKRTLPFINW